MAIRNTKVAKKLARIGVGMLDPDVSVIILESVIRSIADASVSANCLAGNIVLCRFISNTEAIIYDSKATPDLKHTLAGIKEEVSSALKTIFSVEVMDPDECLTNALDSLDAVELADIFSETFGIPFPSTIMYDYPTFAALSYYIATSINGTSIDEHKDDKKLIIPHESITQTKMQREMASNISLPRERVPIYLGGTTRYGTADSNDEISMLPAARWRMDAAVESHHSIRFCRFLDYINEFDAHIFNICDAEVISLDPQQQMLSKVATLTLSPILKCRWVASKVGIYAGIVSTFYSTLFPDSIGAFSATGQQPSAAVGRLSFIFGCTGPSVAVDTACSSSLVAARQALI